MYIYKNSVSLQASIYMKTSYAPKITAQWNHFSSALLRLHDDLDSLGSGMDKSYAKFAEFVTEIKLDHRDGQLKSDQLTKLLVYNFTVLYIMVLGKPNNHVWNCSHYNEHA